MMHPVTITMIKIWHCITRIYKSTKKWKKEECPFPKHFLFEHLFHASLESDRFEILIPDDSGGI